MTAYEKKYLDIAREIVLKHIPQEEYAVFLFGSRADGTADKYADVDLGFLGNKRLHWKIKARIKGALEESIVPYRIDLVDFFSVQKSFKEVALKKIEVWSAPKNFIIN